MKREFLEGLGLEKDVIDQIMAENGSDLQREKARADQFKAELASAQDQLTQRAQADAISQAIAGKGLKFSSRAAERDFIAGIKELKLEWKDGVPSGFDEFIQAWREADPGAFAPDKAPPRFIAGGDGDGHGIPGGVSMAEMMAESIGKAGAARDKAANSVIANYKGGCGFYGT